MIEVCLTPSCWEFLFTNSVTYLIAGYVLQKVTESALIIHCKNFPFTNFGVGANIKNIELLII